MLTTSGSAAAHRCGVWGSPIDHSLSPVLHRAAYAALGLRDWTYDRRDVDEPGFPAALAALDPSWRGLSLTMPLKEAALAASASAGDAARATGAANTLVRRGAGWHAENTDVHGIRAALAAAGVQRVDTALVVGSGATARSAVAALASTGARSVTFMVRGDARADTLAQARAAGLLVDVVPLGRWRAADVVVSTVPPEAVTGIHALGSGHPGADRADGRRDGRRDGRGDGVADDAQPRDGHHRTTLLDVVYGGGPTALETAARTAGWTVVPGVEMLLHQATEQVRIMTGRRAPVEAMRAALAAALSERVR